MTKSQYTRNGLLIMRRSKLEIKIDILKALACHGRLKLTHLMYKAKVNCGILKQYLELLVQHKLVKEEPIDKKRVASATLCMNYCSVYLFLRFLLIDFRFFLDELRYCERVFKYAFLLYLGSFFQRLSSIKKVMPTEVV